jgi:hypothetical protein
MSNTLIDSVHSVFTDSVLSRFAILLGETEASTAKAVHGAIPMVLTDILYKAWHPEAMTNIRSLSRQAAAGDFFGELHELTIDAGGLLPGSVLLNKGASFAQALLVSRTDIVINEISRWSGIGVPSAAFFIGIVSFASLDAIGRQMAHSNHDESSVALWIKPQADSIIHAIPAGLQVKQALGIQHYPWEKSGRRSSNTALYVMLVLIVVAALFFVAYQHVHHTTASSSATTDTTTVTSVPADAAAPGAR